MYIRLNYGANVGELQFVRVDVAQKLVDSGRATDPRFEGEVSQSIVATLPPETVAQAEAQRVSAKRTRR